MSDRSDWRPIPTMAAGQRPDTLEQAALQHLIRLIAPPGTVLTATVFNLYASAVNQATADLAAILEQRTLTPMDPSPKPEPTVCPTPCEPDCTDLCHADHLPAVERDHQPDDCPAFRAGWHWLFGRASAWMGKPLPTMEETTQAVIDNLGQRGIRLVVPGCETPPEPQWPAGIEPANWVTISEHTWEER